MQQCVRAPRASEEAARVVRVHASGRGPAVKICFDGAASQMLPHHPDPPEEVININLVKRGHREKAAHTRTNNRTKAASEALARVCAGGGTLEMLVLANLGTKCDSALDGQAGGSHGRDGGLARGRAGKSESSSPQVRSKGGALPM